MSCEHCLKYGHHDVACPLFDGDISDEEAQAEEEYFRRQEEKLVKDWIEKNRKS